MISKHGRPRNRVNYAEGDVEAETTESGTKKSDNPGRSEEDEDCRRDDDVD